MALHAPFLVKQYLSDDLEHGSYSRIFWYYPLDEQRAPQGGIGLFFEVLSGDVDDDVYEQITKRFWESFNDHFYTDGFEPALKHSIRMFIQLLRSFGVEEGLDVNIVLCNVVLSQKGYILKLITFGDSDIFVVRQGKYADMGKLVPVNASLYDLKFLEVELDKGDALLLGNKTLLRNAFEADMLLMGSLEELLRSLEEFKENLFGSKKLFLISVGENKQDVAADSRQNKVQAFMQKSIGQAGIAATAVGGFFGSIFNKLKKQPALTEAPEQTTEAAMQAHKPRMIVEDDLNFTEPEIEQVQESSIEIDRWGDEVKEEPFVEPVVEQEPLEKEEPKAMFIAPPPVADDTDIQTDPIIEVDLPAVPRVTSDRLVNANDFEVTEEITTAMVMDKSSYQGIVDDAVEEESAMQEQSATKSQSTTSFIPIQNKQPPRNANANYVQELRSLHSPWAKVVRNSTVRSTLAMLSGVWEAILAKVLSWFGKPSRFGTPKAPAVNPSLLSVKKMPPGAWLLLGIIVLVAFFWIKSSFAQAATEKSLLAEYQQTVSGFTTFYEQNIVPIDTEDTEKQLELCSSEAQKVYDKQSQIMPKLKSKQSISQANQAADDVKAKVVECQSKYDRVYGIVRVNDAELVTDFKVSLGNDSDVSSMAVKSGAVIVADKGRKSIYQINVDTKSIMKLEDPLGLVVNPTAVGSGEGTLFVCDQNNGVLYYTNNASGNNVGFNRMVGTEPTSIGECLYVDGFAKNAYVVPATGNSIYKVESKGSGYALPKKYITDLLGVRAISIDGNIYVTSVTDGNGTVKRYFGGKLDSFSIADSVTIGEATASFTNPSNDRPLYVYDKTQNAVLVFEKPAARRHPGKGVLIKTYLFNNKDKFGDVKSFVVDVNGNNQETYMYVLSGTTIWRFRLK